MVVKPHPPLNFRKLREMKFFHNSSGNVLEDVPSLGIGYRHHQGDTRVTSHPDFEFDRNRPQQRQTRFLTQFFPLLPARIFQSVQRSDHT